MAEDQSHNPIHLQEKINFLTSFLEDELEKIKSAHVIELNKIRDSYGQGVSLINDAFESRWASFHHEYIKRLLDLEEQVGYLRELNQAQHIMLQDYLQYIKMLEERHLNVNQSGN